MTLRELLPRLARNPVKYLREVAPGVHAYGLTQPMSRVRAYQSNVLSPIGGRGSPQETLVVGHLHSDAAGLVTSLEGFIGAGADARDWVKTAAAELEKAGLLAPGAKVNPECPSNACPWANAK